MDKVPQDFGGRQTVYVRSGIRERYGYHRDTMHAIQPPRGLGNEVQYQVSYRVKDYDNIGYAARRMWS